MFETLKLNAKLLKIKMQLKKTNLKQKNEVVNYLLDNTKSYVLLALSILASLATIADTTLTYILLANGFQELNPFVDDLLEANLYYKSQILLAFSFPFFTILYILGIYLAVEENELNTKIVGIIRKLSSLIKWSFVWVIVVRSFCVIWNGVMLYA